MNDTQDGLPSLENELADLVRDLVQRFGDVPEKRERLAAVLGRLFSPSVIRRLGIYEFPASFCLSVVVPVFNEEKTLRSIVRRILDTKVPCEIVLVDDGSSDGSAAILDELKSWPAVRVFRHERNQGKGAAIRTGFQHAQGDVVVIQDADLEYDPHDFLHLLRPILEDKADIVYGSRFSSNDRPVARYWHQTGNRAITMMSNMFTNLKLSDVETCYKMMRRETLACVLPSLKESGFGIELELTAKLARIPDVRFYELPISYSPRGYAEGKKIGWRDGLRALWCIGRYAIAN